MKDTIRKILTRGVSVLIRNDLIDQSSIQFARVDMLTGLPNRLAMIDRLREARAKGIQGSLAFCDLDGFKLVNDFYGHGMGDQLLVAVGHRLRGGLPADALLARFGGDEFCIFLPATDVADAVQVMERLLVDVRKTGQFMIGPEVSLGMSIGLAPFSVGGIEDAFRAADVAMYAAKSRGRNCVVVFSDDVKSSLSGRRELASVIITLQERNRDLQMASRTDALTGLGNRLALDEVLKAVVGSRDLPHESMAVAFIDVDHFGKYNRCYSDSEGDDVLRRLGDAFRASSRQNDMVFRKGGEEFVVVMSDVGLEAARGAAERIRASVEALGIAHAGSDTAPVLTITIGVASGGEGTTVRDLMVAAGKLATAAKNGGHRNQVHAEAIL